jgi:hypothetical protein
MSYCWHYGSQTIFVMFRVDTTQKIVNEFRHMSYLFRGTKH